MRNHSLISEFEAFIELHQLHSKNILIAVSGGLDSMVLANVCLNAKLNVSIAHLHYGLRAEASDQDADFVHQFASTNKLSLFVKRVSKSDWDTYPSGSIQMKARALRYAWFEELKTLHHFDCICTAHHLNDSIETFFANASKGTGIKGLMGIPAKRDYFLRPFLKITKSQIKSFAEEHQIEWREDASNAKNVYLRNQIRNQIIPELQKVFPAFESGFLNTFERLEGLWHWQRTYFDALKARCWIPHYGGIRINISNEPNLDFVLCQAIFLDWFEPLGFVKNQIDDLTNHFCAKKDAQYLSHSHVLELDRGQMYLISKSFSNIRIHQNIELPINERVYQLDLGTLSVEKVKRNAEIPEAHSPFIAYLPERLALQLCLRTWKNGDRMQLFGMKGFKKLGNVFTDLKIPSGLRASQVVLENQDSIVWIPGIRASESTRRKPSDLERPIYRFEFFHNPKETA